MVLAEQRGHDRSRTPSSAKGEPTPEGSPSWHTLPSPPPPPAMGPFRRPRFELRVLPRTSAINKEEACLSSTLVAMISGVRPSVGVKQMIQYLVRHFQISPVEVMVKWYKMGGFLLVFSDRRVADRILHAAQPADAALTIRFSPWTRQAGALFSPLRFKVLLSIDNIPAHVWSMDTAQVILGSSCLVFDAVPSSRSGEDLSRFLVAARAIHPSLIPEEVGCVNPEPEEPFVEHEPPLSLLALEIIHSKLDTLQFRVFIKVLEVHDFSIPDDSGDEHSGSDPSEGDDFHPGCGLSQPWPKVFHLAGDSSSSGDAWPSLPTQGGGVSWTAMASRQVGHAIQKMG
jgi:hypothetical protein